MFNLYRNEMRKLWAKKSSWILLLISLTLAALTAWGMKALNTAITSGANSASTAGVSGGSKAADAFLAIFSMGNSLVSIFAIVITAIIITEEFSKNTIKILLTRPYSRHAILFSKFLASLSYLLISSLTVYVFSILLTGAFFGFGGLTRTVTQGMNAYVYGIAAVGTAFLANAIYLALVFILAAGMRSQGLAITFSILMTFVVGIFSELLTMLMMTKHWYWLKWNPFNLLNFNPLVKASSSPAALSPVGGIIGLLVYTAIFYLIADYIFNRRDVSLS
ncbi:ABC transporter permease [Schleiferilactobacillus perolens]|jgi:ABC-2 type transport system permease protein|uniref:ABC transporter permease n=1 Tax=Schleiferilactobacillus perolens DSM 12744 TaxID=1423792 RepID=A0A0R1NAG3_9LACO|nr:ABC transporter permease subunit [Schleiferilactobacillus perolens]KRL13931.1 hypothetical protein FD09_GL001965 [Schleiferilactobacillus perolens DSM 12744]MCI1893039.1 ABC transporter permease [Schleiferilactobacillus harbinensis]MCI1913634.1 ABC transporter permease [Schleiferilactobacillus harbinensis]MCI2171182.1 ABC transporter permease [Schleiferilactobacillus perolens]